LAARLPTRRNLPSCMVHPKLARTFAVPQGWLAASWRDIIATTFDYAAVCEDPSTPISQLPAPKESAVEDVYAREDADYERLVRRWRRELEVAQRSGDLLRIEEVERTLRAARLQRNRQLAERIAADDPPF
ncbi:MAG: hypothetical protein ABI140_14760, partial [Jatrophihabitantaceae bacterium]